jgi:hypothetical protein
MKEEKTEEQKNQQNIPNPPWLDTRLTKEAMDHLRDMDDQQRLRPTPGSVQERELSFGGPNNKVYNIKDKNDWFFENVLKECSERLYYKDWNNYYNVHIAKFAPPPVFELTELWVNCQKQHEFNPPHVHLGCMFSFVVFMKIPTHWKEQQALPWLKNVEQSHVSDFQFILGQGMGPVQTISISLCPEDEGRILFFPAWLTHQVFPSTNAKKKE